MKRPRTDVERFEESSSKNRRFLRQEELILEVTELLSSALEARQITKSELAEKLGKTKGFVTQVLSGNRNLTLRTIADIADALEYRIRMTKEPVSAMTRGRKEAPGAKVLRWIDPKMSMPLNRNPYSSVTSQTIPTARGANNVDQLAA